MARHSMHHAAKAAPAHKGHAKAHAHLKKSMAHHAKAHAHMEAAHAALGHGGHEGKRRGRPAMHKGK